VPFQGGSVGTLRFMNALTYNVHCSIGIDSSDNSPDLQRIGRGIAAMSADVVGLHEIEYNTVAGRARPRSAYHQDDQPRLIAETAGLRYTCFVDAGQRSKAENNRCHAW